MIYLVANMVFFVSIALRIQKKGKLNDVNFLYKQNRGKIVRIFCFVLFILLGLLLNEKLDNPITSFCIALMPASIPSIVYDIIRSSVFAKEKEGITSLLMVLTKWSAVKNDAVYCLQKTNEIRLSKPIGNYINDICIRLEKGMSVSEALIACEKTALSEELRYVMINIRYAYEKGGSLYRIFKSLENQFFKIDEENFKRKINTASDKYAVYIAIIMVMSTFFMVLLNKNSSREYFLNTETGMILLGVFAVLFFTGIMIITKNIKRY
ncbi:MAG: type II secretion system F family protein [Clostridia bacterium]|jgi:NADH:ubiquinone oxidoreductase subunit 6 (subunit J)